MFNQLQCMRSFIEVVERGNFSRAAHALRLGPASVSEHVANLEQHLGIPLLNRTTRALKLTDEGTRYYALCKSVADQILETEQLLARRVPDSEPAGMLRVEIAEGIDEVSLPAIAEFQECYPNISLQLLRTSHEFDFSKSGSDVMIRSVLPRLEDNGLVARTLGRSRTAVAAAPAYIERFGTPETPDDLMKHRCIGYVDPLSGRLWEWFFQAEGRSYSLDVPCTLSMAHGGLRRLAAARGMGVINDLAHIIAPYVKDGALVPLLDRWAMEQPMCHIVYPREQRRSLRTSLFIKFMEAWFETHVTPIDLHDLL